MRTERFDVAIIGGGPGGSTVGSLVRRYDPTARVVILEKEVFPRDHVGESQLPEIGAILNEMGCWDKVEAAGFPIKIGATYRWGSTDELWDFEFINSGRFQDEPRPARYVGQRTETAFQVDRAVYDKILLDHAAELGCDVRQATQVRKVERDGDLVAGLVLDDGSRIEARHYIDASGNAAVLRKAMGVEVETPTSLQNIAIWDYWENAEWAVEIGVGGTRVQVMSLGYGWIWFIPLGPSRASVGLVVPAEYYKSSGVRPEELYLRALSEEPRISGFLRQARREEKLAATKDWSFVSSRWQGDNWFLVGEAGGFADPILAAGMTLTHTSAREAAYTILALDRQEHDPVWLRQRYERDQAKRVRQHMKFAEFWYTANGRFTAIKENCSRIAKESGLDLDADSAFRWLGTGGFALDTFGSAGLGFMSVESIKQLAQQFTETPSAWQIGQNNVFRMNVQGAKKTKVAAFHEGRIYAEDCLIRGDQELPFAGLYGIVISVLHQTSDIMEIAEGFLAWFRREPWLDDINDSVRLAFHTLEAMVATGWVEASHDPTRPRLRFLSPDETLGIHPNRDGEAVSAPS
ncbi:MAG: tryptophan 7-halogenase [Fimbriimonadaceae bacterium]|nr:tryptophan 7-halogenase [Fimbriimonadaceae bacterium]